MRCLIWQSLLLYSSVYQAMSGLSTFTTSWSPLSTMIQLCRLGTFSPCTAGSSKWFHVFTSHLKPLFKKNLLQCIVVVWSFLRLLKLRKLTACKLYLLGGGPTQCHGVLEHRLNLYRIIPLKSRWYSQMSHFVHKWMSQLIIWLIVAALLPTFQKITFVSKG